jgi:hypothetical protein
MHEANCKKFKYKIEGGGCAIDFLCLTLELDNEGV